MKARTAKRAVAAASSRGGSSRSNGEPGRRPMRGEVVDEWRAPARWRVPRARGEERTVCRRRAAATPAMVNDVEQRRGGTLPGRSIPDETTTVDKASALISILESAIALSGPLAIARVRAGRHVSRPEPESAGLLPRLNDLLVETPCYLASLID
ncbi:hypothetical protein Scep_029594 [Stephania cephalantha]|uniref:Uncharacterized protein n=1 Tax=Stephania cephalantha TaxID=152367 RepID=A0AAP0E5Q2_9MAGN